MRRENRVNESTGWKIMRDFNDKKWGRFLMGTVPFTLYNEPNLVADSAPALLANSVYSLNSASLLGLPLS